MSERYVIGVIQKNVKDSFLFFKEGNIGVTDPDHAMMFKSSKEAWKFVASNGFHLHTNLTFVVDIHPGDRYA